MGVISAWHGADKPDYGKTYSPVPGTTRKRAGRFNGEYKNGLGKSRDFPRPNQKRQPITALLCQQMIQDQPV